MSLGLSAEGYGTREWLPGIRACPGPRAVGRDGAGAPVSAEGPHEPAFGSASAGRLRLIDRNKLFCLIKVAPWSLVSRSPIEN